MDFLCQSNEFFKNPLKVPLNELTLELKICVKSKKLPKDKNIDQLKEDLSKYFDIRREKVPAISVHWIQKKHSYTPYQPYYFEVSVKENEDFLIKNKLFLENINFLLNCSYHLFWCYFLHEPRVIDLLNSFITNPISVHELKGLNENYLNLYESLHESVSKVIMRLVTFEESEIEYMREDVAMNYLIQSGLFSSPKIIDMYILYGQSNVRLIERITDLFFSYKREKCYKNELKAVLNHSLSVFDVVGGYVCGFESNLTVIPSIVRAKPQKFDPFWYEEIVSYMLDTATSLSALFTHCEPAVQLALSMGIPHRLAYFHKRVYEELLKLFQLNIQLPYDWSALKRRINECVALGRSEFVDAFHAVSTYLVDKIIQTANCDEQADYIEQYFKLTLSMLEDDLFAYDYKNFKDLDVQVQMISDFCPEIDRMRIDYVHECLSTIPTYKASMKAEKRTDSMVEPKASTSGVQKPPIQERNRSEEEIEASIQEVLDALPHLGDDFVLKCLEFYNYNPHEVIAAILDDNLSPVLRDVPPDSIRIPPESRPEEPILSYRGKKPDYKDAKELLNDKSAIRELKDFVLKSSNVYYDVYDDEYDDRFDDDVPIRVHEKAEEPDLYKYMENRFEGYDVISDPSSTDDEDVNDVKARKNFCEDPALMRERKEAQRRGPSKDKKHGDLVGRPKGQGQEKNVLVSRTKKNVNKSSRANHNRKSGAQWKRNKGMIPS